MIKLEKHNITRTEMERYLMRNLDIEKIKAHEFFAMNTIDCELVISTVRALDAFDKLDTLKFITRKIIDTTPMTLISVTDVNQVKALSHLIVGPFRGLMNIKIIQRDFEFKKKSLSSREWMIDFRTPEEPKVKEEEKDDIITIDSIKMGDIQLDNVKIKDTNETMRNAIKACVEEIVSQCGKKETPIKQEKEVVKPVEEEKQPVRVIKIEPNISAKCEEMIYKVFDSCATEKVKISNENLTQSVYETLCNLKQILDPKKFIIRELYISNTGSLILKTSASQYYTGVTRGDKIELSLVHEDLFKIITANKKHIGLYVEFTQF